MSISVIVGECMLNHDKVEGQLSALTKLGLLEEKRFGRIRIYRFRTENTRARGLKTLIEFWEN